MKVFTKAALIRVAVLSLIVMFLLTLGWNTVINMPGKSYRGDLPPLTEREQALEVELRQSIESISGEEIGEHNYFFYSQLEAVADWIESEFTAAGYEPTRQTYQVNGQQFHNLEVEKIGTEKPEEIIIIGAHYDSVVGSPGANDNGSGTAAVLALAREFAGKPTARTLRFVAFTNEEPPFFWTENMGSFVYAKGCRDRQEKIVGMLSLETMGYYSDQPGSQEYPLGLLNLFYPITGNFITFVSNLPSGNLLREVIGSFRSHTQFPSEGAAMPGATPGAGWSDHWSFWQFDYPALMVTDTAPFRYPFYHTMKDTPDQVNYDRLARVVSGLERVIEELVQGRLASSA
jgi:hypothetical protein